MQTLRAQERDCTLSVGQVYVRVEYVSASYCLPFKLYRHDRVRVPLESSLRIPSVPQALAGCGVVNLSTLNSTRLDRPIEVGKIAI